MLSSLNHINIYIAFLYIVKLSDQKLAVMQFIMEDQRYCALHINPVSSSAGMKGVYLLLHDYRN